MNYISWFLFIIAAPHIYLWASELFLPEKNQESFRQALKSVEDEVFLKGPEWTALSPIYYMSLFLDKYLGKKLVSRRSISIASIFATILVISTIWLTNIPTNKGDFLQKHPFILWNQGIELQKEFFKNYSLHDQEKLNKETSKPEELEETRKYNLKLEEREEWLLKLNRSGGAYIFSIVLLLSCFVSIIILSSLTLAITRQVLREMIYAKGFLTLLSGFILNVLLAFLLSSFYYLVLLCISAPLFWIMLEVWITILAKYTLVAYPVSVILAYFALPEWIKLVVLVPIIPLILLAFFLLLFTLIFILRRPIHSTVLQLLRRALEYKYGPIVFFTGLLGLISYIIKTIFQ